MLLHMFITFYTLERIALFKIIFTSWSACDQDIKKGWSDKSENWKLGLYCSMDFRSDWSEHWKLGLYCNMVMKMFGENSIKGKCQKWLNNNVLKFSCDFLKNA